MTEVAQNDTDTPSRVLMLLQAKDLATLRDRSGKLSVAQAADLLIPVVSTLAAARDAASVHRDLQPEIGVVLYQCLIKQRLAGRSMDAVIEQVMAGEYKRPRQIERSIPRSLEAIITRTLREHPDDRFASMRDLGGALLPFASRHVQQSYAADLGPSIGAGHGEGREGMTAEAIAERHARRRGDLKAIAGALVVVVPLALIALRSDGKPASARTNAPASAQEQAPAPAVAPDEPAQAAAVQPNLAQPEPAQPEPAQPEPAPEVPPAQERDVPSGDAVTGTPAARASSTYAVDLTVDPTTAWIMLDRKAAGSGSLRRKLPLDGQAHELHVGAPGYKVRAIRFKDAPPPRIVALEPATK